MSFFDKKIPKKINRLPELAYNLWWSWTPEARNLFKRLDYPLWRRTQHNPVQMLQEMTAEQLEAAASNVAFIRHYEKVMMLYDQRVKSSNAWFPNTYPDLANQIIAYFSFEFGLHSSLPIYSGGLGILSGDHAKEASDLGLPFIGVGFLYPQGYFRQQIPSHGWQEAVYKQLDINQAPLAPVCLEEDKELHISVYLGDRNVYARVWHLHVGRTSLYLLDTDVDENDPWDRELSARLYSGDSEMRIRQEILLGIGGVRALRALGFKPAVWHMNEGHSAFLLLELIRDKIREGMSYTEAKAYVTKHSVFTTHTPVPAGHDAFTFEVVGRYFNGFWDDLGLTREEFMALGEHQENWGKAFNMTVLALKLAGQSNAVSQLHGEVSREMWQDVWPEKAVNDVPIMGITNGVHLPTWVSSEISEAYSKYLGPQWMDTQDDPAIWRRLSEMPDKELWTLHLMLKRRLMDFFRSRARRRWVAGVNDATQVMNGGTLLDPDALTIGFARRFATYKRADLIFRDIQRLKALLLNVHCPVQLVFAGKAHPADDPGKRLIQKIYSLAKSNELGGRVAFVEDYEMHMARYLTQGVDIWLNTPRRPREASGTSGMKASVNGVPNFSVLDGWWVEGYNGANGWAIGKNIDYADQEIQDNEDAESIYRILEDEIVPLYYDRDHDDVPRGWVEIMRESIRSNAPKFSMTRMIKEYTTLLYIPAMSDAE
ncbi:MAG: alpha-glucan phosphorylase [Chloroflexi bacterium]|nr:MAG: alpha-glucan phosphorylase [Chloroflexota bacterium]